MPTLAGTKLDKYDMLEEVGHGGMAVVYRGRDSVLEREVAVKVLHPHLADREESRERLRREAVAVAKLRHENILEIFDYSGTDTAESYIVTEFIHGPTLRDWMDRDYQPRPAIAAMIVHRLALALSCAHKGSIVHRDIKPENVMIRHEDGCIKLMDFGIAQILDNQKLTMTGQLIGSPAYMAPELISGRPLDARTDLFSLGILLFQLATGELPFAGRNPHEVLNRIADGNYPLPSTICPLVDLEIEAIIQRALANNPDERFQSADTLAADLEEYLAEIDLEPSPAEMRAYFHDPVEYVRELDARVSTALMVQAEKAAREGLHGRAIRLLGRVLELDKDHKAARALLVRLRVREKRMRQLLFGGATLGLVGLVGAGWMLIPPPSSDGARSQIADEPDDGLHAHARAQDGPSVPSMPTPAKKAPARSGSDTSERDAGGIADDDGSEGETTGADARTKPGAGKPTPGKAPQRTLAKADCTIQITNAPKPTMKTMRVVIDERSYKVKDGAVTFVLEGDQQSAELVHSRWRGSVDVRRDACGAPVLLSAKPKPTTIKFNNAPPDLAVICVADCPPSIAVGKPLLPGAYKDLDFGDDAETHKLRLTLKAGPGFETRTETHVVNSGTSEIDAKLDTVK